MVEPCKPFRTDGCSMWPDGNYRGCCVDHDRAYWIGGEFSDRMAADQELRECVEKKAGWFIAMIMYYGVRIGGWYRWPVPWRWGYGHPYPHCK